MDANDKKDWKKQAYFDIYKNNKGFSCYKWTHYPFAYDQILDRYLDLEKPLRLLEIGVQNGGSLEIWKKYLPPGSEIHGMDINPKCLELDFSENIHFHLGSAADEFFVHNLFFNKSFDIIIDDGSHLCSEVIGTFPHLFKKLNPGGVYIIEDLHTSYWEEFGGRLYRENSSIEFFKKIIDAINAYHIPAYQLSSNEKLASFLKRYRQEIASISFFDSICAITRFGKTKSVPFTTVVSGNVFKVAAEDTFQNKLSDKLQEIETVRLMYSIPDTPALTEIDGAAKKPDSLDYGIEAFAKENFNAAIEYLSAAMAEKPDDPLPCAYLAFICARQGLVREARDFIAQSARIAPERADLVAALGETFLKSGKPLDAAEYLREAIQRQPDLFAAYPAFAQSLHLAGQSEEAVSALQAACHLPSNAQAAIRNTLMQILAECGDVSEFAKHAMRFSQGLPDDLMAARCLARFDESGEQFIEALSRVQARLESVIPSGPCRPSAAPNESGLIRIAFMVGDFTSPHQFEQLYALFRYLPPERFFTLFITACFHPLKDDMLQKCFLLADTNLNISDGDDEGAIEKLRALAPDILVDMNVCAPSGRLAVFLGASVAHKLMWGEAPIAPIAPDVRVLAGKRLSVENMLPAVPLPEIGEVFDLPERPLTHRAAKKWGEAPVLGCLVPAAGIGRNGWRLFAETLRQHPSATLVINLEELGEAAERFIAAQFSGAGVAPERLVFIQARTAEDYCLTWQSIDLGLMPPVHFGGLALPSCLWMGRPCLVPDAILPWSQRPAALLKALGKEEWIAMGEARFIDLARQLAPPDKRLAPDPLLRARMKALGLTDAKAFAQGFAEAMTALFQNAPAAPFDGQSQP